MCVILPARGGGRILRGAHRSESETKEQGGEVQFEQRGHRREEMGQAKIELLSLSAFGFRQNNI